MRRAAAALALAVLTGCSTGRSTEAPAAEAKPDPAEALIAFARASGDATWAALPLADSVGLGLGDTIRARRTRKELRNPRAWVLGVDLFRGRAGTASALELIADEDGPLALTRGPHPHCASGPVPAPAEVADLVRLVVQPRDADGCLDWWTVDAFVNDDGEIEAVTLDLWEP